MGFRDELMAKLVALKAQADALNAGLRAGRPAKALTAEELAQRHPRIAVVSDFQGVAYGVRLGTWFGWIWLAFTSFHCVALFYGLAQGSLKMNGRTVAHPEWWHFALLALFYAPFFLVGFAFTLARYQVILRDDLVTVRWRILPGLGWTWTLPAGDAVKVSLAYRGSRRNKQPVESIVVESLGKEIDFGAFLAEDTKERLAALIRHYYGDGPEAAAFIEESESRR
jgi:hypothetical protein